MSSRKKRRESFVDWDSFDLESHMIRAEKEKARALRKTRWWQQQTAAGVCYYCEKEVGFSGLTMDHILPLSRGGRSSKENIVACCKECNTLKNSMMPLEWTEYCDKIKNK